MITREQLPELRTFAQVEKGIEISTDSTLGSLVVPNGNAQSPGHRWFKYKESFSADLLTRLLSSSTQYRRGEPLRVLDPFCGVGTTLLSAQLINEKMHATGIECNPFALFVANTKLSWPLMDTSKLRRMADRALSMNFDDHLELPSLSSITSGRCISHHMSRNVIGLRKILDSLPSSAERNALVVGLAAAIEPVSKVRRDGRALRIVGKPRVIFRKILAEKWKAIVEDVEALQSSFSTPGFAEATLGDGRAPQTAGIETNSVDLIVTSPPYPNNIDYNEVYKLELWLLGHATDEQSFLALRRATYRSHPTCQPLDSSRSQPGDEFNDLISTGSIGDLVGSAIERVGLLEKSKRRGRRKVLVGYIHDTWQSLKNHYSILKSGGCAIYIVGNSLHGGTEHPYLVPTDLIFAKLGESLGFSLQSLTIARGLQRRLAGNHFLRDSIVVLRKT